MRRGRHHRGIAAAAAIVHAGHGSLMDELQTKVCKSCELESMLCLFLRVRNHSGRLTKQPRHVCQRRAAAAVPQVHLRV